MLNNSATSPNPHATHIKMEEEVKYLRMRTIGSLVGKAWEVARPKYHALKNSLSNYPTNCQHRTTV